MKLRKQKQNTFGQALLVFGTYFQNILNIRSLPYVKINQTEIPKSKLVLTDTLSIVKTYNVYCIIQAWLNYVLLNQGCFVLWICGIGCFLNETLFVVSLYQLCIIFSRLDFKIKIFNRNNYKKSISKQSITACVLSQINYSIRNFVFKKDEAAYCPKVCPLTLLLTS